MTDRHRVLVVVLDDATRDDDLEAGIGAAIRRLRGVADVYAINGDDHDAAIRHAHEIDAQHSAIRWHQTQLERLVKEL